MSQYGNSQYGSIYGLGENLDSQVLDAPFLRQQFVILEIPRAIGNIEQITPDYVFNQFDQFGLLLGLPRLSEEKNYSYKQRLFDVFVHRANSTYRGLVNGITRELGLSFFYPIQINIKKSLVTGDFFAPDPYIKISGAFIYLYSDFQNDVLDYKIDIYESGGNYEFLGRLVDFINTTTYFEAYLLDTSYYFTRSTCLVNQSNREKLTSFPLNQTTKNKLNMHIVNYGIIFDEPLVFKSERFEESEIKEKNGRYYIDYIQGIVTSKDTPSIGSSVTYSYVVDNFKPIASPAILYNINHEDFKEKIFQQVLQDSGEYTHGLGTEVGIDIINELLSVYPSCWGK